MASSLFGSPAGTPRATATGSRGGITPQTIQQVRQMMNMLRGVANPQEAVMQAAQMNPALGAVVQLCQGRNPKDVFYEQCRQHGVNPDEVIGMLC